MLPNGYFNKLVLTISLFLIPNWLAAQTFPGTTWTSYSRAEDAGYMSKHLTELRDFIVDNMNTTGLVVVVKGKVLFQYGDIEELSYLASCRKSILAMLYGNYVSTGKVELGKTLNELNIEDNKGLLPIEKTATVRDLITARSGIYHPASNGGDDSANAPPRGSKEPGSYMLYNNWDFNAAGSVFEMLSGMNIYDAIEKDLAQPIGMEDFQRWTQRKSGNLERSRFPAYHIWLSTRDMARIGLLMLHEGNWNGTQVIPKSWSKEIVSVVTPLSEMNPSSRRSGYFGYGYMWWVWDGPNATGAFEGAYSARGAMGQYITVLPVLKMVIAHKTKRSYGRRTSWENYENVLNRLTQARIHIEN